MKNKKHTSQKVQDWLDLPEPIENLGHELILAIMFTARTMNHNARKMLEREAKLTDSQFNLMFLLRYQFPNGATQTDLSKSMLVNRANITGLVDRLERDGLVERRARVGDRRAKVIFLTSEGEHRLTSGEKPYFSIVNTITNELNESERKTAIKVLGKLCDAIIDVTQSD